MTIIDQSKLASVVHDSTLRRHITLAVENDAHGDSPELLEFRDYLVHEGLAYRVAMVVERPKTQLIEEEEADE